MHHNRCISELARGSASPAVRAAVGALAVIVCAAASAAAQLPAGPTPPGWFSGATIGMPVVGVNAYPEDFVVGATFTQVRPGRFGLDFQVGTGPTAIHDNEVPAGARLGFTYPYQPLPRFWLLPTVGASWVGDFGDHGASSVFGWHTGAAAVFAPSSTVGLRLAATMHFFSRTTKPLWLVELGVVHVPLPTP